jgi:hypothetical protein
MSGSSARSGINRRHRRARRADEGLADQPGKAEAEDGDRQPRRDLIGGQTEREQRRTPRPSPCPASAPMARPARAESSTTAPAKPTAAPMIIMPSTPRLSTPARSTTCSPSAGDDQRRRGGDDGREDQRDQSIIRASTSSVTGQRLACQHAEQQQPHEGTGHVERQLQHDLCGFRADQQHRQHQRRDQRAHGGQAAEKGDDDGGEAVALPDRGLQAGRCWPRPRWPRPARPARRRWRRPASVSRRDR